MEGRGAVHGWRLRAVGLLTPRLQAVADDGPVDLAVALPRWLLVERVLQTVRTRLGPWREQV